MIAWASNGATAPAETWAGVTSDASDFKLTVVFGYEF